MLLNLSNSEAKVAAGSKENNYELCSVSTQDRPHWPEWQNWHWYNHACEGSWSFPWYSANIMLCRSVMTHFDSRPGCHTYPSMCPNLTVHPIPCTVLRRIDGTVWWNPTHNPTFHWPSYPTVPCRIGPILPNYVLLGGTELMSVVSCTHCMLYPKY